MKRMNLRDIPEDVYAELTEAAAEHRQSLNAYVVDRLAELARVARVREYVVSYTPPVGSRVTLEDAVAAVRVARETS
jgi:plasmid stability protein